ncbi:hypothetical protein B484DRAFT_329540 [Ochromonadaceae sp. CCMP2298]|nr:hypothetical protein B484DRAFT_329540 [Ochromonadaceae sp. CCMP2298]
MDAPNLYAVLGVAPTSSQEQLKTSYQRLLLAHHPDKSPLSSAAAGSEGSGRFIELRECWAVLGDVQKRQAYDEVRRREQDVGLSAEVVDRAEFSLLEGMLIRYCRCGGVYELEAEAEGGCVVQCDGCSLFVRLEP